MKIYIEQHPNTEMRTFHTSENFANRVRVSLGYLRFSEEKPPYSKRLRAFSNKVSSLKETCEVSVCKNNISVKRNPAHSWEDVSAAVVALIEKFFREKAEVEMQERQAWMDHPAQEDLY